MIFGASANRIIACGRDPNFPPWRDVAQLNYFNPDTRLAMAGELRTIAAHCDGVRCDMAMLVLNDVFERTWRDVLRDRWTAPDDEFWPETIRGLPKLLFLAEVYWDLEWTLQQQGFHYTYDKRLLDRLRGSTADDVRGHLRAEPDYSERMARFLENHDEPRSAASLAHRLPAAAAIFATLPGMRFYFDGQIEGRSIRTPVQLARWVRRARGPAMVGHLRAVAGNGGIAALAPGSVDAARRVECGRRQLRRPDCVPLAAERCSSPWLWRTSGRTPRPAMCRSSRICHPGIRSTLRIDWRTSPTAGRADRSTCGACTCDSSRGRRTCSSSQGRTDKVTNGQTARERRDTAREMAVRSFN